MEKEWRIILRIHVEQRGEIFCQVPGLILPMYKINGKLPGKNMKFRQILVCPATSKLARKHMKIAFFSITHGEKFWPPRCIIVHVFPTKRCCFSAVISHTSSPKYHTME